jgi:predicted phosphohydrolase|tara:strand:+ start:233 stop:418 length:186 start_codon:yes stop_codon:yes gene_type:complete
MKIFGISILHLSFSKAKPMEKFGSIWKDHYKKIEENWKRTVEQSDIVLIPGDFLVGINLPI